MKTKPKLIRVLVPPVSLMMMQHQQQERRQEEQATSAHRRASLDSALADIHKGRDNERQSATTRDALLETLVKSRPLAPLGFSPNTMPPAGGYVIRNLVLHPCKSLVTYVLSWGVDDGNSGSSYSDMGGGGGGPDLPDHTFVIVQDTKSRSIVFSMTLGELAIESASVAVAAAAATSKSSKSKDKDNDKDGSSPISVTITSLGPVEQLAFHDQSTLYWNGFTGSDKDEFKHDHIHRSWSYLMIHCENRILMVDLQTKGGFSNYSPESTASVLADITPNNFFRMSSGKEKVSLLPSISTNGVVAVSKTKILLAFADGSLKVYDWNTKHVVQAARWSSGSGSNTNKSSQVKGFTDNPKTTDSVVMILPANPYSYNPEEAMGGGATASDRDASQKKGGRDGSKKGSRHKRKKRQLVLCVTKKSMAYLCDLNDIDTKPPLVKMEVDFAYTNASATTEQLQILARYDAFRDLFFWASPSKNHKSKLFVWDLSIAMNYLKDVEASWKKGKPSGTTLSPDPVLISQLPYEGGFSLFPGWVHKSFPADSVACLVATRDGELQVSVSPLYNTGSTLKKPFEATVTWSVKLPGVMVRDLGLSSKNDTGFDGEESKIVQPKFKVQSVDCSSLQDPSVIFVGTSIGIQMIQLLDGLNGVSSPGTRYVYFNANTGNMGKSVLSVQGSQLSYSPLDPPPSEESGSGSSGLKGLEKLNPIGKMEYHIAGFSIGGGGGSNTIISSLTKSPAKPNSAAHKVTSIVYESPPPLHLPVEVRNKRCVRSPPQFLPSPSGKFVCSLWTDEMRYEVLIVSVLLASVTDRNSRGKNPLAASGTGVSSFAWVGDDDVFCLLYDPEQDEALKAGINLGNPEAHREHREFGEKVVGFAGKLTTFDGMRDLGKDTGKLGKKGLIAMAQGSAMVVTAPIKVSVGAGKIAIKGARKGTKKVSKKMPFGWGKKKDKKATAGLAGANLVGDDDEPTIATSPIDIADIESELNDPEAEERAATVKLAKKAPWVELRMMISTGTELDETLGGGGSGATVSSLGQLSLRSGNRNPPTILFGGPVLCVGSKFDETDEGFSYFYTKKSGQKDESASVYVSSGPAFPCPDIVAWDDDGRLCAIAIRGMVTVYLSEEPSFVLLGTVSVGSSSSPDSGSVISLMFLHGVLYCTTNTSVKCIFLGDLSGDICHLDSVTLASSSVPLLPSASITTDYDSLTPPTMPMPLHHPEILGYQNGSLVLSTTTGVIAIPLGSPLLRIGALLSAGADYQEKAMSWFEAVPDQDHEALALFLDRRGVPGLALHLAGISIETTIDLCMRYGFVDRLEEIVELYGLDGIRAIDCSRGVCSSEADASSDVGTTSLVVCVGAYLLGFGRVELVRRLATECLTTGIGDEGKKEAFLLAGLLLSVNEKDSRRVIQRSVEDIDDSSDWVVGPFVRKHVL